MNKENLRQIVLLLLCLGLGQHFVRAQQWPTGFYRLTDSSAYPLFDSFSQQYIYLDTPAICTSSAFKEVYMDTNQFGALAVNVVLTRQGADKLARATEQLLGKQMAIIVDGQLQMAPYVQHVITGGRVQVSGRESTVAEMAPLMRRLEAQIPAENRQQKGSLKEETALLWTCYLLDSAMMNGDTALLAQVLHPLLSMGHSNGWEEDKADMLFSVSTGVASYESITEDGYTEVKLKGKLGRVRRKLKVTGIFKGHPYEVHLQVLEVWIKEKKQWQLFARQGVKIN